MISNLIPYISLTFERLAQVVEHIRHFKMPGLARKLLLFAAVDGLFLQPVGQRSSSIDTGGIQVGYGNNKITTVSKKDGDGDAESGLEIHGIVGRRIHPT